MFGGAHVLSCLEFSARYGRTAAGHSGSGRSAGESGGHVSMRGRQRATACSLGGPDAGRGVAQRPRSRSPAAR